MARVPAREAGGDLTPQALRTAVAVLLLAIAAGGVRSALDRAPAPEFGITFSAPYARYLGEDPEAAFVALLDELGVRRVRLAVPWDEVERERGSFDFSFYDRLLALSAERGAKVTLAIGQKVPRWPECVPPAWAAALPPEERGRATLDLVAAEVAHFRGFPAVERYQVENEALFPFGACPKPDPALVLGEVAMARALDGREVQLTASGELESWALPAIPADVLGVSLYRTTWNDAFGYFRYPVPPWFYRVRAWLVSPWADKVIISELQAEPWFHADVRAKPLSYWARAFTASDLRENARYARATGLPEAYLWGAEWWYHLRRNGFPELWEEAETLFQIR